MTTRNPGAHSAHLLAATRPEPALRRPGSSQLGVGLIRGTIPGEPPGSDRELGCETVIGSRRQTQSSVDMHLTQPPRPAALGRRRTATASAIVLGLPTPTPAPVRPNHLRDGPTTARARRARRIADRPYGPMSGPAPSQMATCSAGVTHRDPRVRRWRPGPHRPTASSYQGCPCEPAARARSALLRKVIEGEDDRSPPREPRPAGHRPGLRPAGCRTTHGIPHGSHRAAGYRPVRGDRASYSGLA
jgi:hypothetical protein